MRAVTPIGVPPGTRALRIERVIERHAISYWRLWINTRDFRYGTFLVLWDDGAIDRVTCRSGEGDDVIHVKPKDDGT